MSSKSTSRSTQHCQRRIEADCKIPALFGPAKSRHTVAIRRVQTGGPMTKAQTPPLHPQNSAGRRAAIALVDRAIDAMGGEVVLANLKTIGIRGQEMVWEHEYSYSAMPNAEVRESSRATFHIRRDLARGATRIDWDRDIVRLKFRPYPTL